MARAMAGLISSAVRRMSPGPLRRKPAPRPKPAPKPARGRGNFGPGPLPPKYRTPVVPSPVLNRSTKGSPPFTAHELACGYRKLG